MKNVIFISLAFVASACSYTVPTVDWNEYNYQNPTTISALNSSLNNKHIILKGKLTKQLSDTTYTFKDSNNDEIKVEIVSSPIRNNVVLDKEGVIFGTYVDSWWGNYIDVDQASF